MADEQRQQAFMAAAVWHPSIKSRNEGETSTILLPLALYLAVDKGAVTVQVARKLVDAPDTGEVEILITPFAC